MLVEDNIILSIQWQNDYSELWGKKCFEKQIIDRILEIFFTAKITEKIALWKFSGTQRNIKNKKKSL